MAFVAVLWPHLRALQVYGANTGVGKTIFSTVLCRAFAKKFAEVLYLKPVSTGPLDEADDQHISLFANNIQSRCLYQYDDPVSPHIAARSSSSIVTIRKAVYEELQCHANTARDAAVIVETAGAVLSPSPSGSLQADLYRPLRLPVLLVGDHRLGGIGSTISAWESLHVRGYDVQSVALFEEGRFQNYSYLRDYFAERDVNCFSLVSPPDLDANRQNDKLAMETYYGNAISNHGIQEFARKFSEAHERRVEKVRNMPREANEAIWHPFMQHKERSDDNIVVMDSAYGDYFQTYTTQQQNNRNTNAEVAPVLRPAFDGSASWWTQGLGHGNPQLALTAANAAGRYGHVMFASAVHEPALTLAQTLIVRMGNPRLSKVFYTDNGSTGMEVAVKMALRAASVRNRWSEEEEIGILGLTNSYHGDTIGTMDCSEPSIYNKKVAWYSGRGHWLDFPTVQMRRGEWLVEQPASSAGELGGTFKFDTLDQIFDFDARVEHERRYRSYLDMELSRLRKDGKKFGALILEPILLGAGGMIFADPLFQRCLVQAVRAQAPSTDTKGLDWSGMPVIFDEVFTGLYRLGRFSAASYLGVDPDIVVNAKLLTGGLLPLCTTTASQGVFEAFLSDDKSDALLHGHSYTAHAVGCAVANDSLKTMMKLDGDGSWDGFRSDWNAGSRTNQSNVWSMWSQPFLVSLSYKPNVGSVFALGSVLAISLKDPTGSGYASTAATGLRDRLLADAKGDSWVIHSRVLGNVLYLMAAMTTTPETLRGVQEKMLNSI